MMKQRKKLILVVIDAMNPGMFRRTIREGGAPILGELLRRGVCVDDCVVPFPSVTPVCAATIATGTQLEHHGIPSMNWYLRDERRYVEYGTSVRATQRFGFVRPLTDTVYNLNREHLSRDVHTIFERLDDADIRTAGTTFLVYRGRHRHVVAFTAGFGKLINATIGDAVYGPREFFYASLFASRKTGCRGQLGIPGARDRHSGCVGSYLVEQDLCDFMLLSLPDNDGYSHRNGPAAQARSIAAADVQLARVANSVGGLDALLEDYAVIVCSDHSQSAIDHAIDLFAAFSDFAIQPANGGKAQPNGSSEIAVCPGSRFAQIYVLDRDRREEILKRVERNCLELEGVDQVMHLVGAGDQLEACVRGDRSELRFAPSGDLTDTGGNSWSVEGDLNVLGLSVHDTVIDSKDYPDALNRIWSALLCGNAGDVLLSARPGYEFIDWGGGHHVGGGSHGSLHAVDSHALLMWCGTGPNSAVAKPQWALTEVSTMVLNHFDLDNNEHVA